MPVEMSREMSLQESAVYRALLVRGSMPSYQ